MPIPLHWHTEPLLLFSLLGVFWLYAAATGPWRERIAPGAPYPKAEAWAFYGGLITLYIAVGSPIDQIGEQFLFSVHMVQHMLLVYVAAPMLLWGMPPWLIDWLLTPARVRKAVKPLVHPVTVWLLFTFVFTIWHIPVLYELALQDKFWHIVEHWTMFAAGFLFWWPLLTRSSLLPRISHGGRMLLVFVMMIGQFPVFAFLTFSDEVLYPTYALAPRIFGISAIEDQILGGVIMKVIGDGVAMLVFGLAWYGWYRRQSNHDSALLSGARRPTDASTPSHHV